MNYKLFETLRQNTKEYYTVSDLLKILNLKRKSVYVILNRLVKSGILIRLKNGIYQKNFSPLNIEKVVNQFYYPSYLSFESALSKYGVISQIPYLYTFTTLRKTKKITLAGCKVEYHKIKKDLYFGYKLIDGIFIAEPEKAFLDLMYFVSYGKEKILEKINIKKLNKKKVLLISKKFPERTQKLVKKFLLI